MIKDLPNFPDFRLFTINDIKSYYDYYLEQNLNPYVDIHPENLFVWLNINNDLMISNLDGAIVLVYTNILNKNQINIIPLANPLNDSCIERVFSYLKHNNLTLELREIPSILCNKLSHDKWLIENDRDSYEYILNTTQQAQLQGSKFRPQRNRISIFNREHSNDIIDIKCYKRFNNKLKNVFLHHINTMPLNSNVEFSRQNTAEPLAIFRNLEYALTFNKKTLVIKINDKIVSLAMYSYLDSNTAAFNHLKVDYSVREIFQYTLYELVKILKKEGINEINMEQDLGIAGLRSYKERLQPSRFLEKKIIRPRHL